MIALLAMVSIAFAQNPAGAAQEEAKNEKVGLQVTHTSPELGFAPNIPAHFTLTESLDCKKGLGKDNIKRWIEHIKHPD